MGFLPILALLLFLGVLLAAMVRGLRTLLRAAPVPGVEPCASAAERS